MTSLSQTLNQNKRIIKLLIYIALALFAAVVLSNLLAGQRPYRLVQSTITGLLIGGIYALIALGIVIINKASGVFNFAHGWMMLIGGLIFYAIFIAASGERVTPLAAFGLSGVMLFMAVTTNSWKALKAPRTWIIIVVGTLILGGALQVGGSELQIPRAILGAVIGAAITGLVIERFAIRPLLGQPLFATVLMTLAVSEAIHGITQMIWGSVEIPLGVFAGISQLGIPSPMRIDGGEILDGTIIINTPLLVAFVLALVAFGAFVLFFRFTNVGLAMRATAENQKLAQTTGLRVRTILAVAWAIAALLATTAGVLQGGATTLSLNLPLLALRAFPAVLLGGLESISGAFIGGLVIGLVQEWANLLFPGTQAGTELAPYVVLMLVLVLRPDGLFGQKRIERI